MASLRVRRLVVTSFVATVSALALTGVLLLHPGLPGTAEAAGTSSAIVPATVLLDIGGTQVPVASVSGLENASAVTEVTQSTKDGKTVVIKTLGAVVQMSGQVTVTYNVTTGTDPMMSWRQQVLDGAMSAARRNSNVIVMDTEGREAMRFNLTNSWPSKVAWSDLKAGNTDPVQVTVTIEHEGLSLSR